MEASGARIARGIDVPSLDREKLWEFVPVAKVGDFVTTGDPLGTVQETSVVEQKIMVPQNIEGTVEWIYEGEATIVDPIAKIRTKDGHIKELTIVLFTSKRAW